MTRALLLLFVSLTAYAQTNYIYGGIGNKQQWFAVGTGLKVTPVVGSYPRLEVVGAVPPVDTSIIPMSRLCTGAMTITSVLRGDGTCGPVPAHAHAATEITSGVISIDRLPVVKSEKLVYDATVKAWLVPAKVKRIEDLRVYGIAYVDGVDYAWDRATGRLTALSDNMPADGDVRIRFYDQ